AAARPDHRDVGDLRFAAVALLVEHAAEGLVGEDAGEVVDAAVALGLTDDGDDLIGGELAARNALFEAARVLHCLELDLRDFNRHSDVLASNSPHAWRTLAAQHLLIPVA